jgi:hypothetical protein
MPIQDDLAEYQHMMSDARGDAHDINAKYNRFRKTIQTRFRHLDTEDATWLLGHLSANDSDLDTKAFIATVLEYAQRLPESFFEPLIHTAIYETNPSRNRYFVEPAVRDFGFKRVAERLLEYLNDGTNFEKGGAVNAFYWARVSARNDAQSYSDLRQRIRNKYLTEFVANEDTQVRRCIIPSLDTDSSVYSPDVRMLLTDAISIARNHADDYIRHRIEVQMGNETLLQPLPDRTN